MKTYRLSDTKKLKRNHVTSLRSVSVRLRPYPRGITLDHESMVDDESCTIGRSLNIRLLMKLLTKSFLEHDSDVNLPRLIPIIISLLNQRIVRQRLKPS